MSFDMYYTRVIRKVQQTSGGLAYIWLVFEKYTEVT